MTSKAFCHVIFAAWELSPYAVPGSDLVYRASLARLVGTHLDGALLNKDQVLPKSKGFTPRRRTVCARDSEITCTDSEIRRRFRTGHGAPYSPGPNPPSPVQIFAYPGTLTHANGATLRVPGRRLPICTTLYYYPCVSPYASAVPTPRIPAPCSSDAQPTAS